MRPHVERASLTPETLEDTYDVVLATLGYEARSSFISREVLQHAGPISACAFPDHHTLSFDDNVASFERMDADIQVVPDSRYREYISERLVAADSRRTSQLRVALDVSSASRFRIAAAIAVVAATAKEQQRELTLDIWYTPALFAPPPSEDEPMQRPKPVIPELTGRSAAPSTPLCTVIGLGYEPYRALGVVELFEPERTVLFLPHGANDDYLSAVHEVNAELLNLVGPGASIEYPVLDPSNLYSRLESAVFALQTDYRVSLVPLGPKIFAAAAMIVSYTHDRAHSVWRVSPGVWSEPRDAHASGFVAGMHTTWNRPEASETDFPAGARGAFDEAIPT